MKGHLFGMDSHGLREDGAVRSSLEVNSVKSESLVQRLGMTMMLAGFLENDSCLLWCVRGLRLVARVAVCAHTTLFFMTVGKGVFVPVFGRFPIN
jgi:hypothetical protein